MLCLAAIGASALLTGASAAQTLQPGYQTQTLVNPAGTLRRLNNGDLIAWDGSTVQRLTASGIPISVLADFSPQSFFAGCLAIAPDETTALVGESSNGDLFRVDLVQGGATLLGNLPSNYDASFEGADSVLISAASGQVGAGNEVWRLDTQSGNLNPLLTVPGSSGPLDVDPLGNLILATVSKDFPAPVKESAVYLFLASQLTGAPPITEASGFLLGDKFDGATSLFVDPGTGQIFMSENNFTIGANRIRLVQGGAAQSPILFSGPPFGWLTLQGLIAPQNGAQFDAYQPEYGGQLMFNSTDFFSYDERLALAPARPLLTASGPGAGGPGPFDLHIDGGPLSGLCLLAYGPTASAGPEMPLFGLGQPLAVGLSLANLEIYPQFFGLDANGGLDLPLNNSGMLTGLLSVQAACFDAQLIARGTSTRLDL